MSRRRMEGGVSTPDLNTHDRGNKGRTDGLPRCIDLPVTCVIPVVATADLRDTARGALICYGLICPAPMQDWHWGY